MCGTCETTAGTTETAAPTDPGLIAVTVTGMTCGGCAANVTEHVGAIDGVTNVDVDVASGRVTVTADGPVDDAAIDAAVAAAGYAVAR